MISEADDAFLHVHLDHVQPKSRLQNYTVTSELAISLQNLIWVVQSQKIAVERDFCDTEIGTCDQHQITWATKHDATQLTADFLKNNPALVQLKFCLLQNCVQTWYSDR